ncbi:unnamed protein product [Meganyctiphanes norvegica]|uniref:Cation/H+ exchanger transmembrane domain-containing protein n=1 Tax=Meganyctiphanes norvegica TaxID=48144 RepID=A0AAV2RUM5_MEGNR
MLNSVWEIFEPLLFVLIGTEIKVGELKMETVGWGVLILFISLSFRMVTSFIVVMGGGLTLKERLFVSFAWLPKATVQAAVGSKALDYARTNLNTIKMERFPNNEQLAAANVDVELGTQVLTIAVLSILITAPIGAIAIMLTGPSLLSRSTGTVKNAEESNTNV